MKITIDGKEFEVSAEKANEVRKMLGMKQRKLADVPVGETYFIGDIEFIKFPDLGGGSVAVMRNAAFRSAFNDSKCNNFAESTVFKRLNSEVLPKITAAIGEENVLEFETDLLTLDGLTIHGTMRSKISLPTLDYYRANRALFDKYKLGEWAWLATADTEDTLVCCVSPRGIIRGNGFYDEYAVRPFLIFDSNIFVS